MGHSGNHTRETEQEEKIAEETLFQSFRASIFPVHPTDSAAKKFVKRTVFYTFASFLLIITVAIGSVLVFFL